MPRNEDAKKTPTHMSVADFSLLNYAKMALETGKKIPTILYPIFSKEVDARSVTELAVRKTPFRTLYLKGWASSRERKFTWETAQTNKKISYYQVVIVNVSYEIYQIRRF